MLHDGLAKVGNLTLLLDGVRVNYSFASKGIQVSMHALYAFNIGFTA